MILTVITSGNHQSFLSFIGLYLSYLFIAWICEFPKTYYIEGPRGKDTLIGLLFNFLSSLTTKMIKIKPPNKNTT